LRMTERRLRRGSLRRGEIDLNATSQAQFRVFDGSSNREPT